MSIEFEWSKLDSELEEKLFHILEDRVSKLDLPSYIKNLKVTGFHFGDIPPQINIQDIGDPDPQFYEDEVLDQVNDELEGNTSFRTNFSTSVSDLPPYGAEYRFPRLAYFHPAISTPGIISASGLTSPLRGERPILASESREERNHSDDFQVTIRVQYDGNASLSLEASISINYPNSEFVSLPFQLVFKEISIDATAVLAKMGSRTHLCFVDTLAHGSEENASSVIKNLKIESVIGESNRQLLKNVAKVERYVSQKVKRIIEDELVWPSYLTFE
ncbi:Mdm10/Mdm12/Mmm1 complex subunit Mdm12 [Schizosaccharomyces cryophilus OY26]|uniref:Mitochondrial distribution and morphology protein 12 n=1 Tax=Schizosaccharomyces cryophilus (strain OY26 / ATCC MYA-4695 / CBS 11777 / NBRC 106824 / NRRL Y48691) TaxID=653667 RepID=S9VMJ4_SCHCR|nr:Mdm10/Mdm12/Mmm1 complex subunit Mdm12 [Schizosaccharomyces cryophilus OY26]EPY49173.1 Mdm10/Mdm12/Mmm1 complex subunit Mdm12 [Schizosaccharomyces cryophilus OY26]